MGLIVWGTIELPMRQTGGAPFSEPAMADPASGLRASGAEAPPILERLPADRRGALLHLQMRDHYVEIHTDRGSELVLMRFGDALMELGGTEGMQVHRSHWIARTAPEENYAARRPDRGPSGERRRGPGQPPLRQGVARRELGLGLVIPAGGSRQSVALARRGRTPNLRL